MSQRIPHHRRIAVAIALAIAGVMPAVAQDDREAALEARVAELEKMVQQLMAQKAAAPAAPAVAAAPAAAPGTAPPLPIQATTILPGAVAGAKFSFGGFIRDDMMFTRTDGGEIADGSVGRDLYLPGGIPVGGADEGTDVDAHIKFSRLRFGVDNVSETGDKVSAAVELDLFGGALGNEVATNTYGVTVRHAYVSWNQWLAGQTWSNFMDVAALPDSVDFIGPTEGTVFVRQPQIRYTNGPWSLSVENPETTITPFHGGTRIVSDDNSLPDFTARYLHKATWGHVTAAILFRQLAYETTGAGAIDDTTTAAAVSISGKYLISANDDLRFAVNAGDGIGRYTGLGVAADAELDGAHLEALSGVAGFIAYRHAFDPKLRGNLYYSAASYDNDVARSGTAVTADVQAFSANLIYSPLPKLDVGAELRFANRELESGADGDLRRLHFIVRYNF
ncbi:MAG TPA: DcaP family trimeric outer membrane transporter [Patescibacteria group bacterium]|nr:DcaP family trimeric outer membrane transporter [Patescibacteria group bacterium]